MVMTRSMPAGLGSALLSILFACAAFSQQPASPGSAWAGGKLLSAGPLFTNGNQIVDASGNPQRLACVGWNGGNSVRPRLSGLSQVSYQTTLSDMVRLGFNCTRVLTSARGALDNTNGYLDVLDHVIDYAGAIGLRVIVDIHNDEGGHGARDHWGTAPANGIWYDKGGASDGTDGGGNVGTVGDAEFQQAWVNLATRWKEKSAILGYDLINEPHSGLTTWGGYDGTPDSNTDIRAMYIRVGLLPCCLPSTPTRHARPAPDRRPTNRRGYTAPRWSHSRRR